jgi:hypothetical protein
VNLGDVIRQVQRIFGDSFEVQINVTDIKDWANEAMMQIVRQAETNQNSAQFTYGPTTDGVTLPDQFIGEKRVTFNAIALEKISINELDDLGVTPTDTAGAPSRFYLWGKKMYIWPMPSTAVTNGLIVWYIEAPNRVDDVNIQLPIPLVFHQDVVRMCLIRARELNEDYEQARVLKAEVDANLGQVRYDQENRARETFPVIRDDPGDWW